MRVASRSLAIVLWVCGAVLAQMAKGPVNLDFKEGEPGQLPRGWFNPTRTTGFPAAATEQCSRPGARCAVLRSEPAASAAPFGNLMQAFEATAYRNKQIRFRASVRVETAGGGRAQLWVRVDRGSGQMGFFDNMGDRPITSAEWRPYEIAGEVSEDATGIFFGMMLVGAGAAYLDAVSFEIVGDVQVAPVVERWRPLAGRGLENLTAYAKLFGYIRHFHPSDEAFRGDWSALAISGVRAVEAAEDPAQLARKLEDFFGSVAPTVRVFPAAQAPPQLDLGGGTRMIFWQHHGFGTGNPQSAYRSERIRVDVTGGKLPAPFLADLGGGVKALIPLALYVDEKGTLPRAAAPPARPKNVSVRYTGNDRATRLADVVIAWNICQHFYPYFDVVRTDWPKALRTALQPAAANKDEKEFLVTLRRLLAALKDGHGGVYVQGQALMPLPVVFGWVQNQLVVTQVAEAAGQPIERGDAVVSIDGKPAAQALAEAEALISGATPQWVRYRAVSELGARPPDQPLTLEIEPFREPSRRRTVTLQRKPGSPMPVESRPEKITELKPGIFYVDLSRIAEEDWKAALAKLESATGIVFDLRGYPRVSPQWLTHLSEKPLDSAQWHIPVIREPDHQNMKFDRSPGWNLQPSKPYLKARKVVLTDGRAISYAESILGIVEHYKLAEIAGGPTAGTNGNVNPFTLPGGYNVTWTGMKVLKQDGSQHHGVGIQPTIPVERTRAGVAAGRDEILERALEWLQ